MRGRGCMAVTRDGTNCTLLDLCGLGPPLILFGLFSKSPVGQDISIASFVDAPPPVSVLSSSVDCPATVSGGESLIEFPADKLEGELLVDVTSSVEAVDC